MNRLSFRLLVALGVLALALQASLPWIGEAAGLRLGVDAHIFTSIAVFVVGAASFLVAYSTGVRSLSHQERLYDAVERAREDYVRLFHASPEGIFSADDTFAFTTLNLSGARLLGEAEPSTLIGRRLPSFCTDPEEGRALLAHIATLDEPTVAALHVRASRDGSARWIELACQGRRDVAGALVGVDGVFRDVTDRVVAEEKARERFEKMQSAYLALGRANRHLALLGDVAAWQGEAALRDEEIVEGVLQALLPLAGADAGAAFLLDKAGKARLLGAAGVRDLPKRRSLVVPSALDSILDGERQQLEVAPRSSIGGSLLGPRKLSHGSCLVLPCRARGSTAGVFELYRKNGATDGEEDKLLRALVAQCAPSFLRLREAA